MQPFFSHAEIAHHSSCIIRYRRRAHAEEQGVHHGYANEVTGWFTVEEPTTRPNAHKYGVGRHLFGQGR